MLNTIVSNIIKTRTRGFLFLSLIAFILYSKTISFDFTGFDDVILIEENYNFIKNPANIGNIFTQSVFSMHPELQDYYYRPVLVLSFMLDAQIGNGAHYIYHLSNIIFHIVASCLLFLFFLRLEYKKEISLLITLLFLVHPAFTTAVAWVPGRNDILLTIFTLASLIKLIDYCKNNTIPNLFFHQVFFLIGVFTKEVAILLTVFFYLFIYYIMQDEKIKKGEINKLFFFSGWIMSIVLFFFMRHYAIRNSGDTSLYELAYLFKKHYPSLIQYIGKLIFPFNLTTYPTMEDTSYIFGFLALITIYIFIFRKRLKGTRYFWSGAFLFILFLLPLGTITGNCLEHRLYLPAIGFSLMCMENNFLYKLGFDKGIARWILISIVFLFCILTFIYSNNFKDVNSFLFKARQTSPSAAWVRLQMGIYYHVTGDLQDAEKEYRAAIALNTNLENAHNNLGRILLGKGLIDEAEKLFNAELRIKPNHEAAYYNLAVIQEERNNFEKVKKLIAKSLSIKPDYADALVDLGILYAREQKYDEALELFFKTMESDHKNKLAYKNTTLVFFAKKDYHNAKKYYIKSKQLGVEINIPILDTL